RQEAPVRGEGWDSARSEQVELVVVPEGADRQAGQPGKPADRDQVRGAAGLHADHPEASAWSRVKPGVSQALSSSREMARRMNRAASADLPPSFWPSSCSSATARSVSIASRTGVRSSAPRANAAPGPVTTDR